MDLGSWEPLNLPDTVETFRDADFRWWISGGHALDLHLGYSWRPHEDMDVGVLRRDVTELSRVLTGWDIHVAAAGRLDRWTGSKLLVERHENNLWCRRLPGDPWRIDVTIGHGDSEFWVYRRNPELRIPWEEAVLVTPDGVPYLAPELQMLFKSKSPRPKDDLDARRVLPVLDTQRKAFLGEWLPGDHRWRELL